MNIADSIFPDTRQCLVWLHYAHVPSIVYCTDYLVSALPRSDLLTLATMLQ